MNKLLQKNNLNENESKFNQLSNHIKFSLSSGGKSGNKNYSPAEMYINSLEPHGWFDHMVQHPEYTDLNDQLITHYFHIPLKQLTDYEV